MKQGLNQTIQDYRQDFVLQPVDISTLKDIESKQNINEKFMPFLRERDSIGRIIKTRKNIDLHNTINQNDVLNSSNIGQNSYQFTFLNNKRRQSDIMPDFQIDESNFNIEGSYKQKFEKSPEIKKDKNNQENAKFNSISESRSYNSIPLNKKPNQLYDNDQKSLKNPQIGYNGTQSKSNQRLNVKPNIFQNYREHYKDLLDEIKVMKKQRNLQHHSLCQPKNQIVPDRFKYDQFEANTSPGPSYYKWEKSLDKLQESDLQKRGIQFPKQEKQSSLISLQKLAQNESDEFHLCSRLINKSQKDIQRHQISCQSIIINHDYSQNHITFNNINQSAFDHNNIYQNSFNANNFNKTQQLNDNRNFNSKRLKGQVSMDKHIERDKVSYLKNISQYMSQKHNESLKQQLEREQMHLLYVAEEDPNNPFPGISKTKQISNLNALASLKVKQQKSRTQSRGNFKVSKDYKLANFESADMIKIIPQLDNTQTKCKYLKKNIQSFLKHTYNLTEINLKRQQNRK